ncbi:DUF4157 domain-containing protein [Mucilaginibacter sabulilitoris]|uniref:DUF4157 domain-containing protein n=1 Tax=Mucilaginibacter sabulilitoris TaxID=1173583 RepID=A0ABZ0TI06_9SPHI|nr:DUF4157 domain-containing protein [Mucilaginibacter sabulilitoris]WPU91354.1 DUF4157 domain-containing protein [Mucilaginibacter sabulilitoris]
MKNPSITYRSPEKNTLNRVNDTFFQPKLSINKPNDVYEQEVDHMADKVMRMPDPIQTERAFFSPALNGIQRKCQHCEEEEKLQRKENSDAEIPGSNEFDNYVGSLGSSGQALPENSRQFFEPRFGQDFSNVRIHTDSVAAKSAQSINALAYTTGNNIVFNNGQYSPESESGKKLMAHELTHVIQQSATNLSNVQRITCPEGATAPATVAPGVRNDIDARAQNIIDRAADTAVPIATRATRAVSDIVCAYYPQDSGKVRNITYVSAEAGLHTQSVGSGATTQGDIDVGDYFVNNISQTSIARRVLQTGHELDHIGQYRTGLAGGQHKDEREFLAFYHNAVADEFAGTRRMADSMRKTIIDQALGYYYCLDQTLQQTHLTKQQELLTKRQTVNGTRGNAPTSPPTACARQH